MLNQVFKKGITNEYYALNLSARDIPVYTLLTQNAKDFIDQQTKANLYLRSRKVYNYIQIIFTNLVTLITITVLTLTIALIAIIYLSFIVVNLTLYSYYNIQIYTRVILLSNVYSGPQL